MQVSIGIKGLELLAWDGLWRYRDGGRIGRVMGRIMNKRRLD